MNKNEPFSLWFDLIHDKLYNGDVIELPVLSGSMMPLLIPRKKIKIMSISWRDVQIGDIIVFKHEKILTAHRLLFKIILFNRSFFYQKGDVNRFGNWINKDQIVGKVIFTQDNSDKFVDLTTPDKKRRAKREAVKQLLLIFFHVLLIIPRRIK
ncbi:MAG: hypothetical protein SVR08_07375 [Spirochaetota bacterium]|nr:hypothetical protein [Spirochaetota bacterium]